MTPKLCFAGKPLHNATEGQASGTCPGVSRQIHPISPVKTRVNEGGGNRSNLWTYIGYFRQDFPNDWSANYSPIDGDQPATQNAPRRGEHSIGGPRQREPSGRRGLTRAQRSGRWAARVHQRSSAQPRHSRAPAARGQWWQAAAGRPRPRHQSGAAIRARTFEKQKRQPQPGDFHYRTLVLVSRSSGLLGMC